MTFGITAEGFNRKLLENILQDISDSQKGRYGQELDTAENTPLGQLNGIHGSAMAELWELLEELYHGNDPDSAAGYLLTVLAALTGTERRAATPSTVKQGDQTMNLNAGATVPAGTLVARLNHPEIVFSLVAEITNPGGSAADIPCAMVCTEDGPTIAPAGTLTVIVTPVSGLNSTTNSADATLGRNVDSDIVLRQRREDQLALRGGSTVSAIKADLLELDDVRSADVLENTSDITDGNGLPPHSFEAVIDDGDAPTVDDDVLAQVIFDSKPAGIPAYGSSSGEALDANGDPQTVPFSRVTLRPVYLVMVLTTNDDFPVDGIDQVKSALLAAGVKYQIDQTVIALALRAVPLQVAGVTDVPTFTLGFSPAPAGTVNLVPGVRARATFSTANMAVT